MPDRGSDTGARQARRPFRLKWRILLVVSLILIGINTGLGFVTYSQAQRQLAERQETNRRNHHLRLNRIVSDSFDMMRAFGAFIVQLGADRPAPDDLASRIESILLAHGAILDMDWDIESINYVPRGARISDDRVDQLATRAMVREEPQGTLTCRASCQQILVKPVLFDGTTRGVLVIKRAITGILLGFNQPGSADIALLSPAPPATGAERRYITPWHMKVHALTNPGENLVLLQALATRTTLPMGRTTSRRVAHGNHVYELSQLQLAQAAPDVRFYLLERVTEQVHAAERAIWDSVVIGGIGLFASEALLLLILSAPTRRLQALVDALPLLGDGAFTRFRRAVRHQVSSEGLVDDIDILGHAFSRLSRQLEHARSERESARADLTRLAERDPLTELHNRRFFLLDFQRMLDQAEANGHQVALLYLDLDQFKYVNDLSGHQTGDTLLKLAAGRISAVVRGNDLLARLGGDEFGLVLPDADATIALAAANKLLAALSDLELSTGEHRHRVSASVGIALFPDHGYAIRELMSNADIAMYQAKDKGRNQCYLYSPDEMTRETLGTRATWRTRIDHALAHDGFVLHYQPILDIAADRIVHYEALLRMRAEDGGLHYPDNFIPVAEHTGQILAIDRWVVAEATSQLTQDPGLSLSVNLSGSVIDNADMQAWLRRMFAGRSALGRRLVFEITETAAIANLDAARQLIMDLQESGCRFALDDFGSGFASYGYIKELGVDFVKIDGAFVRRLHQSADDRLFVKALTDVAQGLGRKTVAEFVENGRILELLNTLNVDYAQGYHIGRPAPLDEARTAARRQA